MTTNYWIFFTVTLALLAFIGYGTFASARLLRHWQPDRNLLLIPAENLVRLGLIALAVMIGQVSGVGAASLGWTVTPLWSQLLGGLVWGILLAGLFYGATKWLLEHSGERYYSAVVIKAITPRNSKELVLVLLAMVPVVLLEELLFRSLLIGGFRAVLPVPLLLIGWSIIFGLLHSPQGLWGMIGAGLAGLLLGVLFLYSGSLLLPLVAHYVTNSIQVVQAMRLGYGRQPSAAAQGSDALTVRGEGGG
jgi:membrane protease YdiL (CAAX protease family)